MNPPVVIVGAVLALLLDSILRRTGRPHHRSWAVGLAVATLIFVGFATRAGAGWLAVEALGVLVYLPFVLLGLRGSVRLLAAGWAAHVLWDLLLHGPHTPFVPAWYPSLCLGFDLVAAVAVLASPAGRLSDPRSPAEPGSNG